MRCSRLVTVWCIAAVTCCVVLPSGCGRENTIARGSPRATAEAFAAAIKGENYEAVAAGWDYETMARKKQPDWDEIPQSQRNLIVGKLQEERAQDVRALAGMMSGEVTVGSAQVEDDRASVPITVGMTKLTMHLIKAEGVWKVLEVAE
jgi:hypothetical protein